MTKHPGASESAPSDPFAAVIREAGDTGRRSLLAFDEALRRQLEVATGEALQLVADARLRPELMAAIARRGLESSKNSDE